MPPLVINRNEVAALLQVHPRWFGAHRAELERDHGFPPPLPLLRHRWDPEAVAAWVRNARGLPAPAAPAGEEDEEAARTRRLAARAQQLATQGRKAA